jgi:methyl coenzyme M reductase subunit C
LVLGRNRLKLLISGRYCAVAGRNAIFFSNVEIFFGIRNIAIQVSNFVWAEGGGVDCKNYKFIQKY